MVYQGIITLLATTYGSGVYSSGVYGGADTLVRVGPLSLPNTGAGWTVLIGIGAFAVAVGWSVWLWQRRRRRAPL
jgi:LPXTG-motif cell wall-anchored protein